MDTDPKNLVIPVATPDWAYADVLSLTAFKPKKLKIGLLHNEKRQFSFKIFVLLKALKMIAKYRINAKCPSEGTLFLKISNQRIK